MTALDLINFRRRFKFTQAECARAIGCSPRSISAWELGQNTIPESIALACSAVCFGLPAYGLKTITDAEMDEEIKNGRARKYTFSEVK